MRTFLPLTFLAIFLSPLAAHANPRALIGTKYLNKPEGYDSRGVWTIQENPEIVIEMFSQQTQEFLVLARTAAKKNKQVLREVTDVLILPFLQQGEALSPWCTETTDYNRAPSGTRLIGVASGMPHREFWRARLAWKVNLQRMRFEKYNASLVECPNESYRRSPY